jgi:hypothetical protein
MPDRDRYGRTFGLTTGVDARSRSGNALVQSGAGVLVGKMCLGPHGGPPHHEPEDGATIVLAPALSSEERIPRKIFAHCTHEPPRGRVLPSRWERFSLSAFDRGGGVKWGEGRGEVLVAPSWGSCAGRNAPSVLASVRRRVGSGHEMPLLDGAEEIRIGDGCYKYVAPLALGDGRVFTRSREGAAAMAGG